MVRLSPDFYKRIIKRGLQAGKSANQMLDELKQLGIGIRRADFLSLVREVRNTEAKQQGIMNIRRNAIISEKHYTPSTNYPSYKYITRLRVEYYDKSTGKKTTDYYSIGHSQLMTRGQIEDLLLGYLKDAESRYRDEDIEIYTKNIINITPVSGYRRPYDYEIEAMRG